MNEDELRRLFDDVSAPDGVDDWRDRPVPAFRSGRPPWVAPVAGLLAVTLVAGGLGAYVGLHRAVTTAGDVIPAAGPRGGPTPRTHPAMAYDAATETVVLYGGTSRSGATLDDTWIYTAAGWTQARPAHTPGAVADPIAAYDPVTHDVLMTSSTQSYCGFVVWLWNGADWRSLQQSYRCPETVDTLPSYQAQMATDPQTQHVVMVESGGEIHGCPPPTSTAVGCASSEAELPGVETREWTGTTWQDTGSAPPATGFLAEAVDSGYAPASSPHLWYFAPQNDLYHMGGACCVAGRSPLSGTDASYWTGSQWMNGVTEGGGVAAGIALPVATAYDAAEHLMVAWSDGEFWSWDGQWTSGQSSELPATDVAPDGVAMAYDAATQQVVLVAMSQPFYDGFIDRGGVSTPQPISPVQSEATWVFDGSSWREVEVTTLAITGEPFPSALPAPGVPPAQPTATAVPTPCVLPVRGTHPGQDVHFICPIPPA